MPLLLLISIFSPVIPLLTGIRNRLTLLWLYPMTGLVFDLIVTIQKRVLHVDKDPASNLFVLVEFLVVSLIYARQIAKKARWFYVFVAALSVFFVVNTVTRTVFDFNAFGASFFMMAYMLYAITGLYTILQRQATPFLERSWFFWLNVAFLMYASGNLLLFLFRDYLIQVNAEFFVMLWRSMFLLLNITKNLLIAVALYHYKPATRESH